MDDFYADWFSESDEEPDNKKPVNAAQLNYNKSSKELAEINNYLKTFDGGYYGYLEIKEGYLFNYFKDNKNYRKAKLTELKEAAVISEGKKVGYKCISNNKCTYSTFTNSYHDEFNFATSKDFNTTELIRILNKILLLTKTTEEEEIDFKKYESNIDILKPSTTNNSKLPNNKINQDTKNALTKEEAYKKLVADYEEMNKHIRTLDNGRYLGVSVENGYIISHYTNRDSSKAKIEDIAYVKAEKNYNYVKLACNGDSKCIYSTITGQYHDYFNFNCTSANIDKTELVLKNFLSSLKNYMPFENQSANSQQPKNKANALETAIKAINEYLPKFNSVTYKQVKVQGDDVLFEFYVIGQLYHAKISKADLKNNTKIVTSTPTTFKIECTNGNSCFWSTFANEYESHFSFFMGANPKGNLKTMQQLVEALVKAL